MEVDLSFTARRIATTGHEIVNPNGEAIAWTVDADWAAILVAMLNSGNTRQLTASLDGKEDILKGNRFKN